MMQEISKIILEALCQHIRGSGNSQRNIAFLAGGNDALNTLTGKDDTTCAPGEPHDHDLDPTFSVYTCQEMAKVCGIRHPGLWGKVMQIPHELDCIAARAKSTFDHIMDSPIQLGKVMKNLEEIAWVNGEFRGSTGELRWLLEGRNSLVTDSLPPSNCMPLPLKKKKEKKRDKTELICPCLLPFA